MAGSVWALDDLMDMLLYSPDTLRHTDPQKSLEVYGALK
jgi:hypothetical protein